MRALYAATGLRAHPRWSDTGTRLIAGILGAVIFLAITVPRLSGQGAQYDELHQAAGAFAYCGRPTNLFSPLTAFGLPVLTMSYSGAIKTALFGIWLRLTGCTFTLAAWRLTGPLLVASGIVLFAVLARSSISIISWTTVLLITDATVILGTRHDYGPVALALMIRLLLIGVWLRIQQSDSVHIGWVFLLGACTGVAVFEKLSSIVLIPILASWVLTDTRLRSRRPLFACSAGLALGLLPLVAVNIYSWSTSGQLISAVQATVRSPEWAKLPAYAASYVSIGAGAELQSWILGIDIGQRPRMLEGVIMVGLLILAIASIAFSKHALSQSSTARPTAIAVTAYSMCLLGTWLLPQVTEVHHWIVGTPFQYAAFGLAAAGGQKSTAGRVLRLGLVLLVLSRIPGLVAMETAMTAGRFGAEWHPDLTAVGNWAAKKPPTALFIAADWGLATQIACLSSGRHVPRELFWAYRRPDQLSAELSSPTIETYYLVGLVDPSPVNREGTRRLFADAPLLNGWREEPVDDEAAALKTLVIRRFIRTAAEGVQKGGS